MKPTYSQSVTTHVSGAETLVARQVFPLWDFEMTFEVLANVPSTVDGFILQEDNFFILQEDGGLIEQEQPS
jgi:hypothetical protein